MKVCIYIYIYIINVCFIIFVPFSIISHIKEKNEKHLLVIEYYIFN